MGRDIRQGALSSPRWSHIINITAFNLASIEIEYRVWREFKFYYMLSYTSYYLFSFQLNCTLLKKLLIFFCVHFKDHI